MFMLHALTKRSLRVPVGKVALLLTAAALALMVWGVAVLYQQRLQHYRHQAERELQAINQLQANSLAAWREQRLTDAMALSDDLLLAQALAQWLRQPSSARQQLLTERLRILQERANYTVVHLVDTQGRILLPSEGAALRLPGPEQQALGTALATAQAGVVEPRRDDFFAFPFFSLLAPVFDGAQPLGAVWLVSDVRTSLFPLLQTWPTPSETAESGIFVRDGDAAQFLSPLRHRATGDFAFRISPSSQNAPSIQALAGARGIVYGRDYRGQEVMAMLSVIPSSPWFMVTKIDVEEVFATTRLREGLALSLPISLGLLFTGVVFALSQRRGRLREEALKIALQRNMVWLEGAQKAASIGYFAYNTSTDVFTLSSMARTIFGWQGGNEVVLRQWVHLIHPEHRQEVLKVHGQALALRRPLRMQYRICRASDQQTRWVQVWGEYENSDPSHPNARMTGTVQDITERKQSEQELADYRAVLEQKVRLDALTLVANRRALDEHVVAQWHRAMRHHTPLSLLMIDVDHFKLYNDHYGHVAGDDCLRTVAQALAKSVTRADELVARYGGEEFAVLLPDTEASQALAMAEKIVAAVRALAIAHAQSPAASCVTVSIGAACIHPVFGGDAEARTAPALRSAEGGPDLQLSQALFEQADRALYQAKQNGRNQAVLHTAQEAQEAAP